MNIDCYLVFFFSINCVGTPALDPALHYRLSIIYLAFQFSATQWWTRPGHLNKSPWDIFNDDVSLIFYFNFYYNFSQVICGHIQQNKSNYFSYVLRRLRLPVVLKINFQLSLKAIQTFVRSWMPVQFHRSKFNTITKGTKPLQTILNCLGNLEQTGSNANLNTKIITIMLQSCWDRHNYDIVVILDTESTTTRIGEQNNLKW